MRPVEVKPLNLTSSGGARIQLGNSSGRDTSAGPFLPANLWESGGRPTRNRRNGSPLNSPRNSPRNLRRSDSTESDTFEKQLPISVPSHPQAARPKPPSNQRSKRSGSSECCSSSDEDRDSRPAPWVSYARTQRLWRRDAVDVVLSLIPPVQRCFPRWGSHNGGTDTEIACAFLHTGVDRFSWGRRPRRAAEAPAVVQGRDRHRHPRKVAGETATLPPTLPRPPAQSLLVQKSGVASYALLLVGAQATSNAPCFPRPSTGNQPAAQEDPKPLEIGKSPQGREPSTYT